MDELIYPETKLNYLIVIVVYTGVTIKQYR